MYNFDYPQKMPVGRVCLEMSLKPFKRLDDLYIENTCHELYRGWQDLIGYADGLAIMLWTSDGSEILQYSGNLCDNFEWCKYIGIGNPSPAYPPVKIADGDDSISLHTQPRYYIDNPPDMSYNDLRRIISALKRVGKELYGLDVKVIETFDPGPEFAYSDFKFHRHPELNRGKVMGMWIHCATKLHADNYCYAAYPDGIPEGTHFGRFLGNQFMALKRDVGFDSLWLSNGFGFSLDSWNWTGELFDGNSFNHENAHSINESINEFWHEFSAAVGDDMVIETRGSNLSTGMDISAHGSPIYDIYKNYNLIAPPNSPWAALNFRFGLELAGYMSHIAEIPHGGYMFRYYIHDPWWLNSPWFDRYGRSPHDIFLPLAIARLSDKADVTPPIGINFLSADDSFGNMPRRCPIEATPHLLEAYAHFPDEAGLMTWVYPFKYYSDIGLTEGKSEQIFMDDWLIENAIDNTLPLNSVISDENFLSCDANKLRGTILLMPVPAENSILDKVLEKALTYGLNIMLYGNTVYCSEKLRNLIGVKISDGIDGELEIKTSIDFDKFNCGEKPQLMLHDSLLSGGAIYETASENIDVSVTSVVYASSKIKRIYSTFNKKAHIAWIRASFPHSRTKAALPSQLSADKYFTVSSLLRGAAEDFGLKIRINAESLLSKPPIIFNSMHDNAMYITEFAKDTTSRIMLDYPDGAPLITGTECILNDIGAEYTLVKCMHKECRFFARQKNRSVIMTESGITNQTTYDFVIYIRGLDDAELTFYPPYDARFQFLVSHDNKNIIPDTTLSDDRRKVTAHHISGTLRVSWQADSNIPHKSKLLQNNTNLSLKTSI